MSVCVCASLECAYLLSCCLFVKQIRAVNCRPKCQSQSKRQVTRRSQTKHDKEKAKQNKTKWSEAKAKAKQFSTGKFLRTLRHVVWFDSKLPKTACLPSYPALLLRTLLACQLFSWPISRGVCSSGCHLACHSINTLMHYSSLHSINKAIDCPSPSLPDASPPFDPTAAIVFLVGFPQNAFNSILFQFNCHIANCIAWLPAAPSILYIWVCLPISVDQLDAMTGTRHQGAGTVA